MRITSTNLCVAVLAFLFTFNSCGSPAEKENLTDTPDTIKTYDVHIVEIKQLKFQPAVLAAHPNDTVLFVNRDIVNHDVTDAAGTWHSSALKTDDFYKIVITKSENYFCALHPVMKGVIVVD